MENFLTLCLHLACIFIMLLIYYFVPAAVCYYIFYTREKEKWRRSKIQKKYPKPAQLKREIKTSFIAIFIFSLVGLFIYEFAKKGSTKMYFTIGDYGIFYFILSLLLYIFINDTIFYWTHRFMHLKKVFRYIHVQHHRSTCPTHFATFAFDPGEAFIHASVYVLLVFFVPIHPVVFAAFMMYNLINNLAGHGGYELMSEKTKKHWFFNWQNTITNHDVHHKKINCNYGSYFVLWDKLMNTLEKENMPAPVNKVRKWTGKLNHDKTKNLN